MVPTLPLCDFHAVVRQWFEETFGEPSPPQVLGWPSISSGQHTLILAPTGSGKTLAAFLWAINHLVEQHLQEDLRPGVRILYVSPLKALNNDIERNLEAPLHGIREQARKSGLKLPTIRAAVRTGDTPQSKRASMLKHPPDILITTPESLYLMLTSKQARRMFTTVQYVIVDEIHSICSNKRGVHLSISLERLAVVAEQDFIRIGLSATQRPLEQVAAFLCGQQWIRKKLVPRLVHIVDAGQRKTMDLRVECAVPDFSTLPQEGVWPLVFTELLELIRLHKTTLIFVNNRRLAERVAAKLNEMISGVQGTFNLYAVPLKTGHTNGSAQRDTVEEVSESDIIQAYHGSMSRRARERMESDLKAGKLRALVATSSLELGIDIGSIDLVVQLQSPKGVARGLQRVGRSGHLVNATSKGRIFPTHREDLVEAAVVARAMAGHEVELTSIPKDCLDVLAQQIVAMVSVEEWDIDELFDLLRQSYCYQSLSRKLYLGVIQMLAGRYTHEAFRELRARISWDKVNNTLRALPGSSRLAITSGGTISDRGYFGVYLEDGKTKVGEVDEEFVYESRIGDTFILGTNVWRMKEIDASRITVTPAPGQPARMPFWRGEGIGRGFELAQQVGAFRREMNQKLDDPGCLKWLQREFPIDSRAAWNIQEYLRRQRESTATIPNDKVVIVEGFRDEIGDPRIVVHSPFGRRINGLLSLVALSRVQEVLNVTPQMLYNDDGVLLRSSDVDRLPLTIFDGITLKEAEEIVLNDLISSPLFSGQFRQNAARALLMPKIAPGKRTPLWLQRLRAGDLLQLARQFDDFPIVIETMREVLNDVLDFEHFKEIISQMESGSISIETMETEVPSPFAASMLFDFIAVYMYEWDQPRENRQSQYLSINRELLSEVVDTESIASLLRPEAIETIERQLQRQTDGYKARSPEELLEILLHIGDLADTEIEERCIDNGAAFIAELSSNGRAVRIQLGHTQRWIAGEEEGMYETLADEGVVSTIIFRHLQSRGPTTTEEIAGRYGLRSDEAERLLARLSATEQIIRGSFNRSVDQLQWCYRPNLERIHRQSISVLRKEITPSTLDDFTHFLLGWQHLYPDRRLTGTAGVQQCLEQLQALPLPSEIWERDILRSRLRDYSQELLNQTSAAGAIVWTGRGSGKMQCVFRGNGGIFIEPPAQETEALFGIAARRVLEYMKKHGASFLTDIRTGTQLSLDGLNKGIAELFWAGLITNDLFAELQNVRRPPRMEQDVPVERIEILDPRHNPRKAKLMHTVRRALKQVPGWSGRWSLLHLRSVMGNELSIEERAHKQALQLLERYGIVAREFHRREELVPWALIAAALHRMEMRGEIRRGYFVEGLSGMQFALPVAVEELRRLRRKSNGESAPLLVNACDPANPYGLGINLPHNIRPVEELRFARIPANYVVFQRGTPILLIENYGRRLWTLAETTEEILIDALRIFVGVLQLPPNLRPVKSITIEHWNGIRPARSPLEPALRSLGFRRDRNQTMIHERYV
jgi:ATP-dependent helicase Lhr and Lhr-like helicase